MEGVFSRWTDGKSVTYKNFASGQPNDANSMFVHQNCVSFFKDEAYKWNDWECDKWFAFVCKVTFSNNKPI